MRVPQVWSLWYCPKVWWSLCSSPEHHQREDLRLPLVLVRHPRHHHHHPGSLHQHWIENNDFNDIFFTQVIYRFTTCFVPSMRTMLLKARARLTKKPGQVEGICRKFGLGDWFLLYQLGKNIDPLIFREFIAQLHEEVQRQDTERNELKLMWRKWKWKCKNLQSINNHWPSQ